MFVKLTDLKDRPIHIRADLVERVRAPVAGEYPTVPGAVVMFMGGGTQAIKEDVGVATGIIAKGLPSR